MQYPLLGLSLLLLCASLAHAGSGYCTYHNYNAGDSLTGVACSDGANGIMTKFKYTNLSPMFPYVTAFSGATWNSPNCGECVKLTDKVTGNTVFLTVIDQCGGPPGGFDAHFDIAPPAFDQLFGPAGKQAGHGGVTWSVAASSSCKGNKGNSGGSPPSTPSTPSRPPASPPPKGTSTTRCGKSWGDANGKCGASCSNDGACAGQHCYADLSATPCKSKAEFEEFTDVDAAFVDYAVVDATAGPTVTIDTTSTEQTTYVQTWVVAVLVLVSLTALLLALVLIQLQYLSRKF